MYFLLSLFTLMSFQICIRIFLPQNIKEDILKNVGNQAILEPIDLVDKKTSKYLLLSST